MYEVGHTKIEHKRRRGDLILAIYGDLRMAEHYRDKYNAMMAEVGLKAEIWSYFGSKPHEQLTGEPQCTS